MLPATPRTLGSRPPRRRPRASFDERLKGALGRLRVLPRGVASSSRLQALVVTVVLVEQAITVLLLWLGGDMPPVARHVLVPAVSAFTIAAALGLVALIRDLRREATGRSADGGR